MEQAHPLKSLLQFQLASDAYATLHLPFAIQSLSADCFAPSPHSAKWTARINSLLHSKESGGRWAGLCLAWRTSTLSKPLVIECAQSWLGVALPMLAKNEPFPILKASVHLLEQIFRVAVDFPEFQRQIAIPNVTKFTAALVAMVEECDDLELKILALTAVTRLIPLYPMQHRPLHGMLHSLCWKFLGGQAPSLPPVAAVEAVSRLASVLPLTGGKVGASSLWRKSTDELLAFGWSALSGLRTTFSIKSPQTLSLNPHSSEDPLVSVPLNSNRLRCCNHTLRELLRSTTQRSVQVPVGALEGYVLALLSCTDDETTGGHFDVLARAMEVAVVPSILVSGCDLLITLAKCVRHHLTPNCSKFMSVIAYHLERKNITPLQRLSFLQALECLLSECHPSHSTIIFERISKALLPMLSVVLEERETTLQDGAGVASGQHRKGKRKGRGYDGDEIFKLSRDVICPMPEDGRVLIASLRVLRLLLLSGKLTPPLQSISSRVLLSTLLALPHIPAQLLSPDLALHRQFLEEVQSLAVELGMGSDSMSKSLGLILGAGSACQDSVLHLRTIDIFLQPRVPPSIRPIPLESLSLFRVNESREEADLRTSLKLGTASHEQDRVLAPNPMLPLLGSIPQEQQPLTKVTTSSLARVEIRSTEALQHKTSPAGPFTGIPPPPMHLEMLSEEQRAENMVVDDAVTASHLVDRPPPLPALAEETISPGPTIPHVTASLHEEDEELMPTINMDSDSEMDNSEA